MVTRVNNIEASMGLQTQQASEQVTKVDEVIAHAKKTFEAQDKKVDDMTKLSVGMKSYAEAGITDRMKKLQGELMELLFSKEDGHIDARGLLEALKKCVVKLKQCKSPGGTILLQIVDQHSRRSVHEFRC